MSTTDFEKNDGLDDLSSEELEARAFGPDTDTPRGAVRGLTPRPEPTALTAASASPTSWRVADPSDGPSRTLVVMVALAGAIALITAGVALFVSAGPDAGGETIVETYDEVDIISDGYIIDDGEVYDGGVIGDGEIIDDVFDGDIIGDGEIVDID